MAVINDLTINYSIPMPNTANAVADDIARLRAAFSSVDTILQLKRDKTESYSKIETDLVALYVRIDVASLRRRYEPKI